jgi:hypothetical protein
MRIVRLLSVFAALLIAGVTSAVSQTQPHIQPPPPAKPGPYKVVAITPPQSINDATFEAFRKQIGEAAQRRDRAALAKLVVAQGFFWTRENGDRADKRKSGADNLAAALGLNNKDGAGWDMLASLPTAGPAPPRPSTKAQFARLPIRFLTPRHSMT